MPSFSKHFVCKSACLATHFFNLERTQASDKNWSDSIFSTSFIYHMTCEYHKFSFSKILIYFSVERCLILRSFSLSCSLHCHIVSIVNDKICLRTLSRKIICEEVMGKSSFTLNSSKTYFCKEKVILFS